jgi:hypothetical protein
MNELHLDAENHLLSAGAIEGTLGGASDTVRLAIRVKYGIGTIGFMRTLRGTSMFEFLLGLAAGAALFPVLLFVRIWLIG